MTRRELIALLASTATVEWPAAGWAQPAPTPVIGLLGSGSLRDSSLIRLAPFLEGLRETGYVEGRTVAIEYRWAEEQYDRLPALASDLVNRYVNVIITMSNRPAALAAKAATTTIPIVFVVGIDPVEAGLVTRLHRPTGNLTGVTLFSVELGQKRLQLIRELVPGSTIFVLLVNPTNPMSETESQDLQRAAGALGLELHVLHAKNERDFDQVFATTIQLRAGGLIVGADKLFVSRNEKLAALAASHAIPVIHQIREFVTVGGLASYGAAGKDAFRVAGIYTGRVLKGDKPADLPVQQATKVELILNLKTARALGLTVPPTLLARADEVIE